MNRKIAFFGCSHTSSIILDRLEEGALQDINFGEMAYRRLDLGKPYGPLWIYNPVHCGRVMLQEGRLLGTTLFRQMLDELKAADPEILVTAVNGTEHARFSMVDRGCDLVESERLSQPVPDRLLARALAKAVAETILVHEVLKDSLPGAEIVALFPAPPLKADEHILENPEVFAGLLEQYGISSSAYRLRVYRLACGIVESSLAALGIKSLAPPQGSTDEDGFLLPALRLGCTHANARYGRMVLDDIDRLP